MKKYIRSERPNLFEPNDYISMVVHMTGSLPSEKIEQAVCQAYEANEATMSRIVLEENGDACYEKMDHSGCKFFREKRPWRELLGESERNPFSLRSGELIRTYLTKENEEMVLLIHAHHLAGDGQSMVFFLKSIMCILDDQSIGYQPMHVLDRAYLEKRAKLFPIVKWYANCINRKWKKEGKTFTWNDYDTIHRKYWDAYASEIEWVTYDFGELKAKCPPDITINSYIVAKLWSKYPKCRMVGIPISIRENDGMSNQTSGIDVKYKYDSRKSFEENAGIIHKSIYKKIKNPNVKYFILLLEDRICPSLNDAILMQSHGCYQNKYAKKLAGWVGYIGDGGRELGVTNLNVIDLRSRHDAFTIENIMFVPPKVSYVKHVVGVATFNGKLTICHHKMKNRNDK